MNGRSKRDTLDGPEAGSRLTHADVARYYDDEYYRDTTVPGSIGLGSHYRRLAARLGLTPGRAVLDIACGRGEWLAAVAGAGCDAYGLDISERALAYCRDSLPGGRFCLGVGERLPFRDGAFDLVTCLGSLEHFIDQELALREIKRTARPGSTILILVPNSNFLTTRLGLYRGTDQARVRETARTRAEWIGMFTAAGLQVQDTWADYHIINRSWICRGSWYLVPLRFLQALSLLVTPLSMQYQFYFRLTTD